MEFLLRAMLQGVAFWAFPILIALLLWKRHTIAGVIRATGRLVWRRKFVVAGALAILVAGFIGLVSFLDYQEDLARHARYAARQDRARADFKVYQERKAAGASRRPCEITIFGTPESACLRAESRLAAEDRAKADELRREETQRFLDKFSKRKE